MPLVFRLVPVALLLGLLILPAVAEASPKPEDKEPVSTYLKTGAWIFEVCHGKPWRKKVLPEADAILELLESPWAQECAWEAVHHLKKEEGGRHKPFHDTRRKSAPATIGELEEGLQQLLPLLEAVLKQPPLRTPEGQAIRKDCEVGLEHTVTLLEEISKLPTARKKAAATSLKHPPSGAASASYA